MKILEPVFKDIIFKLLKHNVSFLLIGGYAVNYYGYGRYTGDIDFWIKPDNENKQRLLNVFVDLGKSRIELKEIEELDFSIARTISLGTPPLRIDFLTIVNLVNFDDAWEKRVEWQLEEFKVPIVDYHHLVLTKFNTGRTKDKLDLEELQKINQNQPK
jgi:hypothetical protein